VIDGLPDDQPAAGPDAGLLAPGRPPARSPPRGELQRPTNAQGQVDGLVKCFFAGGQLKLTARYVDGKLQGERVEYDEHGRLRRVENFKDDRRHGAAPDLCHRSGKLREEFTYVDGRRQGTAQTLRRRPAVRGAYLRRGLKRGPFREFHRNGQVKAKGSKGPRGFEGRWNGSTRTARRRAVAATGRGASGQLREASSQRPTQAARQLPAGQDRRRAAESGRTTDRFYRLKITARAVSTVPPSTSPDARRDRCARS